MAPVGLGWRHPHYQQLLQELPALDFLEVHSENFFGQGGAALAVLQQGRAHYPISLHGVGLALGSAVGVDEWHLQQLAQLVARIDPVRVSDHASFARVQMPSGQVMHAADLLPLPYCQSALDVLCSNVHHVQETVGRTILVENISAYVAPDRPMGDNALHETEFLACLAERTGCGLLLDVNNVYVNACNTDSKDTQSTPLEKSRQWLQALASTLERKQLLGAVQEMHVAGHERVNDAWGSLVIDSHGSCVCEEVWALYRCALELFGPVPTLLEWDTAIPPLPTLLAQVQRMREVQHA
ncbi:DUF692 domain-containing protein [Curvibacter sp. CHRR-16]|nr:DUF692 domain-containing protein [Curvibacter sp. CHRR-16]